MEMEVKEEKVQPAQEKLSTKEKVSFGLGDFSSNMVWGFVGSYLLFFYTDVALVPVAATGTLFLVARIIDAITDPIVGGFVDRTNTKFGRTKPYILFGIIPLAILLVLTFSYFDFSDGGKIVYAYVTYILIGLAYTIVNVPYGSLMTLMTRDGQEKSQLSSLRVAGMALGNIFITALAMPLVNALGGGNQQKGFTLTAVLFAIVGSIGFLIVVKNCKERYIETPTTIHQRVSIVDTYKHAFKNKPWLQTTLFALLMFVKIGVRVTLTIYFCLYVLKNPAMVSILMPSMYVAMLASSLFTSKVLQKFGHRKANIYAMILFSLLYAALMLFEGNMTIFVIVFFIASAINNISNGSVFGMIADSVDYNEWKFGHRAEGTLFAGYSFATKVGNALGAAAIGYILAFIGYNANNVTPDVSNNIRMLFYFVPIICSLLQAIVIAFYKLDAQHPQIVKELSEKE